MKIFFLYVCLSHVQDVVAFLPNTFSAEFEQVYKSSLSGKEKRSRGKIDYQYPKAVRLEMKGVEKTIYVSNIRKSWYYSPPFIEGEAGSLTIKDWKSGPADFFDLLKKGLKSNISYKVKREEKKYKIIFSPKIVRKTDIFNATLDFSGASEFSKLKTVSINYKNRPAVTLHLSKIKENIRFGKGYFQFTPPPNTRINH